MTGPSYTVGEYGSTFIVDEHGARRIPPGERDPFGTDVADADVVFRKGTNVGFSSTLSGWRFGKQPATPSLEVGPRDVHRFALEAALMDVEEKVGLIYPGRSRGAAPRRIRFWRDAQRLVCGVLSFAGEVGWGCVEGHRSGTFIPAPDWERRFRADLGLHDPVDEETGLPPVG